MADFKEGARMRTPRRSDAMPKNTSVGKKSTAARERGSFYTFDRNGALVVNTTALLRSKSFRSQVSAAVKLGQLRAKK
jgi:hypothetical protein